MDSNDVGSKRSQYFIPEDWVLRIVTEQFREIADDACEFDTAPGEMLVHSRTTRS